MPTLHDVMTPHSVEIPAHLEAQAEVPLLSGLQRQGDVLIIPMKPGQIAGLAPVPRGGVVVVRGEAGGNTHRLVAAGPVQFAAAPAGGGLALGSLLIPDGAAAFLIHEEHGAAGIAPGAYRVSRQREQADEARLVAD